MSAMLYRTLGFIGFITAWLLVYLSLAQAQPGEIPNQIRGTYCSAPTVDKKTSAYVRCSPKQQGDGGLTITAKQFQWFEGSCTAKYGYIHQNIYLKLKLKCFGEGQTNDQDATVWLNGRYLMFRTDRVYNEHESFSTMVCRDHRSTPPDYDTDPIVVTTLDIDNNFRVVHISRSGKSYVRSDQYKDINVWFVGDMETIPYWSGVWKRDPSKRMVGRYVVHEGAPGGNYIEEIYVRGRHETTIVARCENG